MEVYCRLGMCLNMLSQALKRCVDATVSTEVFSRSKQHVSVDTGTKTAQRCLLGLVDLGDPRLDGGSGTAQTRQCRTFKSSGLVHLQR